MLQLIQTVLDGLLAELHRLGGIDFHLLVGMDPDACSTGRRGGARERAVVLCSVALQRDVLGLGDDGRLWAHHLLDAVGTGIDSRLGDEGCARFHAAVFTDTL